MARRINAAVVINPINLFAMAIVGSTRQRASALAADRAEGD
jgi:glycerol-3-phosphate O-acyltransferase